MSIFCHFQALYIFHRGLIGRSTHVIDRISFRAKLSQTCMCRQRRGLCLVRRGNHEQNDTATSDKARDKMLVLSRKVGESIIIADEVTITVLECKGNYTRVGITAPREISVQREEIQQRMIKEREETAGSSASTNSLSAQEISAS